MKITPSKSPTYEEKIKQEGAFWDKEVANLMERGFDFENRENFRAKNAILIWEDSFLEGLIRGPYKNEMIAVAAATKGPVLELGCGTGWLSRKIASHGVEVTGYDIAEKNIRLANEFAAKQRQKDPSSGAIKFEIKDLNYAELPPDQFGAVVVWDSLHHLPEMEKICEQIKKTLRPGGALVVWDHIDQSGVRGALSKLFTLFFYLTVPTWEKFSEKVRYVMNRLRGKIPSEESPFEDAASHSLEGLLKKNFRIQKKSNPIAFIGFFIARIRPTIKGYKMLINSLIWLDRTLCKVGILKGEYVYIVATNEKE
ncbi:class I SAM-dependent methyltransferase [Candidatus Peregrinibacteria bacterium]|nr:class I SAM-dependent methyltransferase [Candidatus Peregrinibacteria bacterium]